MIEKHPDNPILTPSDVNPSAEGYIVAGAFNPGATVYENEILLLLRVTERCEPEANRVRVPVYRFTDSGSFPDILAFDPTDPDVKLKDTRGVVYKGKDYLSTMSHIRLARSLDGVHFNVEDRPFIYPVDETEAYGCEDARVTRIEGRYYINFTVVSADSWSTQLAVTDNFETIQRLGIIFHPENKDVAIFPRKIDGKYYALHRPNNSGFGRASIWIAESPDLLHWGNHRCIARPRDTAWESMKIGGGAPPIETPEGWLIVYHGKGDDSLYSLFGMLLDLNDPSKIVKRAEKPLLIPTEPFEVEGFFGNVVFSNGLVEREDQIFLYYGASDESVGLAVTDVRSLLKSL